MTQFEVLNEGNVTLAEAATGARAAVCPRLVVTRGGELVCSYMTMSGSGINDLVPMLSRSQDGSVWEEQGPVWPALTDKFALFCSIGKGPDGTLFLYGFRTSIDEPGETFWQGDNHGMKKNELIWAQSTDDGRTWTDPAVIHTPFEGSHEAPGAMSVTARGEWIGVFAPYNTFDRGLNVRRNRIVFVKSADQGQNWTSTDMLKFDNADDGGAEAWAVELGNGKLVGTCWHFNYGDSQDYPNAYAVSEDGGETWSPTGSTGIMGQSTALAPYGRDTALFLYNHRKAAEPGVGLALVRPDAEKFEILGNRIIWKAKTNTQSGKTEIDHGDWTDFAFGEPSLAVLPDGNLLAVFWFNQAGQAGIHYVKLAIV